MKNAIIKSIVFFSFVSGFLSADSLKLPQNSNEAISLTLENINSKVNPKDLLQVYVKGAKQAIVGDYKIQNHTIRFYHRYDFATDIEYVVRSKSKDLQSFKLKPQNVVSPKITKIYPSADVLPENTLRFYLHFSTPMQPYVAFEHIHLKSKDGKEDYKAFMKFKRELWSPDMKRLTILIDPGRIKRGVSTSERIGTVLSEGKEFSLLIDDKWKSANDKKNLEKFVKTFKVAKGLHTLPSIENWKVSPIKEGTKEVLKINFDRVFDYERLKKDIKGDITIGKDEKSWSFKPTNNWTEKEIKLVVDARLEDIAGNNFKDLMDHNIKQKTKDISFLTKKIKIDKGIK